MPCLRPSRALAIFFALSLGCSGDGKPVEVDAGARPEGTLEIHLRTAPADWALIRQEGRPLASTLSACADPTFDYTTVAADVTVAGRPYGKIGLRKKGYLGSLSVLRPSLRVDFAQYDKSLRFHGARHLTLNNSRQDPSLTHTCMAYTVFAKAGVPAPRCSFAHLVVNDEDLGMYVEVQPIDKAFLAQHFGGDQGTLFEGNGQTDFTREKVAAFAAKTNESHPDRAVLAAVTALLEQPLDEARLAQLETLIDMDAFLRFWAIESLISHWDGYTGDLNNFYAYADPITKKLRFIPWGTDGAFVREHAFLPKEGRPASVFALARLPRRLYAFAPSRDRYRQVLAQLIGVVWNEDALLAQVDAIAGLVGMSAQDPRLTEQRTFIHTRRAEVQAELDGVAPPWALPERPVAKCVASDVKPINGSWRTTFGSLETVKLDPSMTLALDLPGQPLEFVARVAMAGPYNNTGGAGFAARIAGFRADGSLIVIQLAFGRATLAPGTIPFHGFETFGAVLVGKSTTDLKIVGFIGEGTITLEQAGANEGDLVVGRFEGKFSPSTIF